jgi:hypothetical protein
VQSYYAKPSLLTLCLQAQLESQLLARLVHDQRVVELAERLKAQPSASSSGGGVSHAHVIGSEQRSLACTLAFKHAKV